MDMRINTNLKPVCLKDEWTYVFDTGGAQDMLALLLELLPPLSIATTSYHVGFCSHYFSCLEISLSSPLYIDKSCSLLMSISGQERGRALPGTTGN